MMTMDFSIFKVSSMLFLAAVRTEEAMLKAIAKYEQAHKFMKGDMNSQNLDMANMVIKYIVQCLSKFFYFLVFEGVESINCIFADLPTFPMTKRINENYDKIKNICLSSLAGCEYKFGHYSLEYVAALAALMDINALFDRSGVDTIKLNDFQCLSDRTKEIFVKYFERFVQKHQH